MIDACVYVLWCIFVSTLSVCVCDVLMLCVCVCVCLSMYVAGNVLLPVCVCVAGKHSAGWEWTCAYLRPRPCLRFSPQETSLLSVSATQMWHGLSVCLSVTLTYLGPRPCLRLPPQETPRLRVSATQMWHGLSVCLSVTPAQQWVCCNLTFTGRHFNTFCFFVLTSSFHVFLFLGMEWIGSDQIFISLKYIASCQLLLGCIAMQSIRCCL